MGPPSRMRFEVVGRPAHLPARDQLGEGAVWDAAAGALWWVDIVGRRVQRLDEGGEVRAWASPQHVSGAIPCASGGLMLALADGLHRLDLGSGLTTPFARPDPDAGNRSNEVRTDPQGRLWLGTMANNLAADGEAVPLAGSTGGLFRIGRDGATTRLLSGIGISNTLVWSPDGARLHFADSLTGVMWAFAFHAREGALSDRRVFLEAGAAPGSPDGSAMDEEGCLWNARWGGGCVARFTPDGRLDRLVELPALQPTSVAFGGRDHRTMFVTTARQELTGLAPDSLDGALFAARVEVAGVESPRFAG